MPSIRTFAGAASTVALLSFAGLATAQTSMGSELDPAVRIALRFGVAFVIDLVLGGALLGLAPEYAERMVADIRDDPGTAFLWGLLVGIALPIALVLLAITIIGLIITIPGLLALFFVGLIGNAVTILWVGTLLTDDELDAMTVGVGAVVLAILAAVPILGNLATTVLGFFGLGVVGGDIYTSWQG